jgi:flagellar biosynthesis/type III secretory pathway M-ring protein FliF/YscJ
MNESIEAYLAFLWAQFQYDWSVFSNPWILYTIIPAVFYLLFFLLKWWILLAPITVPITTLTHGLKQLREENKSKEKVTVKDQLEQLLKG